MTESADNAAGGGLSESIRESVSAYYTGKIKKHGPTPLGVDWNSLESQELRFSQLTKVIAEDSDFSINDYGCGYGALVPFLAGRYSQFEYCGFDWSATMIEDAARLYGQVPGCRFVAESELGQQADYTIASGIFNIRLEQPEAAWRQYVLDTLDKLDGLSKRGFSFNILTSYSGRQYQRGHLYYADPCFFLDYCLRHFSRRVALLHDYGLYEFTVIVRREN